MEETLLGAMGIEIVEASSERCVATMPVAPNRQPYGLLHGGANAALAETVGSIAAAHHASRHRRIAVGVELSCSHHRAVKSGSVRAVATPLHAGSSLATYAIQIEDDLQHLVCTARLSCMLVQPRTEKDQKG